MNLTDENKNYVGKMKELPRELLQKVFNFISDSTVAMFAHDRMHNSIPGLYGSGSLVVINSVYGVLTAKHVWDSFQKEKTVSKISFSVSKWNDYISEDLSHLRPYYPKNEADICFIEIPQPILGTIKAKRTFYPILRNNMPSIKDIEQLLWITSGFPYEWQPQIEKVANPLYYGTHLVKYSEGADGWDEIELQVNYGSSSGSLPLSLKGMSGGGIWNFRIFYNDDSGKRVFGIREKSGILKFNLLAGVNFWQTEFRKLAKHQTGVNSCSTSTGSLEENRCV